MEELLYDAGLGKKKKWRSNTICCVPQCHNRSEKGFSLHAFPSNIILRKKWILILQNFIKLPKYPRICSAHFDNKSFIRTKAGPIMRRRLRRDAVPSLNLPIFQSHKEKPAQRRKPLTFHDERIVRRAKIQRTDETGSTQVMKSPRTPKKKWSEGVTRLFILKRIEMEGEFKGAVSKDEQWTKLGKVLGPFSGEECSAKWKALTAAYRKRRAKGAPSAWPHYQLMDDHFRTVREAAALSTKKKMGPKNGGVYRGRKRLAPQADQGNQNNLPSCTSLQELIPPRLREPKVVLSRLKPSEISSIPHYSQNSILPSPRDSPSRPGSDDSMESSTQGFTSSPNFPNLHSWESTPIPLGAVALKRERSSISSEARRVGKCLRFANGGYNTLAGRIQTLATKHSRLLEILAQEEERRHRETMTALRDIADAIMCIREAD